MDAQDAHGDLELHCICLMTLFLGVLSHNHISHGLRAICRDKKDVPGQPRGICIV